jgi:hypothetical protein
MTDVEFLCVNVVQHMTHFIFHIDYYHNSLTTNNFHHLTIICMVLLTNAVDQGCWARVKGRKLPTLLVDAS